MRELLAAGVNPDERDPSTRERALHVATRRKANPAILGALVRAGADVNALDAVDQMPLQRAMLACDAQGAGLLLDAGADRKWVVKDSFSLGQARQLCPAETAATLARMGVR